MANEIIRIERLSKFKELLLSYLADLFSGEEARTEQTYSKKTEVYTKTQTDTILAGYVNGAGYNDNTKEIELKHGNTVIATVDATPFIIDGMVDDVTVSSGNLVITFNTDGGSQVITIPISSIFDASNYYTKIASDARYSLRPAVVIQSASSASISPNVLNRWGEVGTLSVTFAAGTQGEVNEYMIEFTCPSDAGTVLTLPNTVRWANDDELDPEAGYTYQISIVDNLAVYAGWEGGDDE